MASDSNSIMSITWWLSAIGVGVLTTVLAGYVKPFLDKALSKSFSTIRTRTKQANIRRQSRVELLRNDKQEQILLALRVNELCLQSVTFFLMGILGIILSLHLETKQPILGSIVGVLGTIVIMFGLTSLLKSTHEIKVLKEARGENDF